MVSVDPEDAVRGTLAHVRFATASTDAASLDIRIVFLLHVTA
jgi:hypothetical protein